MGNPLAWKEELPTVEGYYWVMLFDAPSMARVTKNYGTGGLRFSDLVGSDRALERSRVRAWMGPIQPPDAPGTGEKGGGAQP